jgi:ATP-dependent RNA helicase DeaD
MKFADLDLPPPLLAALTARGYETATGVQAAVLDPRCAGRDLLVSSQTGSGKTVAFGAALAATLLGHESSKEPKEPKEGGEKPAAKAVGKSPKGNPIALAIVPTRELALQVREELRWLLHGTGLRLASFTGGTPVSGDLKTLSRGVEVVIGTPGRLVDLTRRERLELGELRVVVLDEADEMLDLGFREDLETLLQAAPTERRTLLLSATLPPEIRALARRYQRDALPIDPRKLPGGGQGPEAGAHDDITHRAHLIAGGDRIAAVVNVLRAADGGRAIVFCTTREGVSEMHAKLVARGFSATAISGDRAQAERDRALEQLRRGDAQVLVATNVAARGIHLPDVDLIVHADLPLNADSLIHRSGRTGRAGRKGTAVVIATAGERRKAERLMAAAHVTAAWTPAPSGASIQAAARARLADEIVADASGADGEPPAKSVSDGEIGEVLGRLEAKLTPAQIIRGLLARELKRLPGGEALHSVELPRERAGDQRGDRGAPPRPRGELSRDAVTFRVNLGGKDNADPRWLLPLICRRGDVTRRDVGAIRIGEQETLFEIAAEAAHDFELAARERDPRAVHVSIERADGAAPSSRRGPPHAQRSGGYPAKTGGYPAKTGAYPAKSSGYPAKSSGYPAKTGDYPAKAGGFGPKTSGFGPKTSGFGPKTSGFGPKTSGFGPKASGFAPKASGFAPKGAAHPAKGTSHSPKGPSGGEGRYQGKRKPPK